MFVTFMRFQEWVAKQLPERAILAVSKYVITQDLVDWAERVAGRSWDGIVEDVAHRNVQKLFIQGLRLNV